MTIDERHTIPNRDEFLKEYWQKKPLLLRGIFPEALDLLDPNELAGLSCLQEADSRIVRSLQAEPFWAVDHGPFKEEAFSVLGESNWTLLVQNVERYFPHLLSLHEPFRFLPNWRFDDIMVSFAATGGTVGPHTDRYDVFLVQGMGERTWHLGGKLEDPNCPLLPLDDIKVLAEFNPDISVQLEAGDVLYVPPHLAHFGVANSPCMTYSIGFRAPSLAGLFYRYACDLLSCQDGEGALFQDGSGSEKDNPGVISQKTIECLSTELQNFLKDTKALSRSFGRFLSEPKHDSHLADSHRVDRLTPSKREDQFKKKQEILELAPLVKASAERYLYYADPKCHEEGVFLFVEGDEFILPGTCEKVLEKLCQNHQFSEDSCIEMMGEDIHAIELLHELIGRGYLSSENE